MTVLYDAWGMFRLLRRVRSVLARLRFLGRLYIRDGSFSNRVGSVRDVGDLAEPEPEHPP